MQGSGCVKYCLFCINKYVHSFSSGDVNKTSGVEF